MNEQQLFIPNKLSVGFQKREGTYTKKLAFVVCYDLKGVRRKEKSWNGWRDQKIPSIDYDNTPTEGFVLNKGVGGARASYGWNARNEYIRVYDPRDFEFEISVANLLFILREGDCSRGKGLEGKFVYAWDRDKLVLLPVASPDYQNSKQFTQLQDKTVAVADLVSGASYTTRKQKVLTYLGKLPVYSSGYKWGTINVHPIKPVKQHVFWEGKSYEFLKDTKTIAIRNGDGIAPDYAELLDAFLKSKFGSKVVKVYTKPHSGKHYKEENDNYYNDRKNWVLELEPGVWIEAATIFNTQWDGKKYASTGELSHVQTTNKIIYKNGALTIEPYRHSAYKTKRKALNSYGQNYYDSDIDWLEPTNLRLYAQLESGEEYALISGCLMTEGRAIKPNPNDNEDDD